MKNKFLCILLILLINNIVVSFGQIFQWANHGGTTRDDAAIICKDNYGNYYTSGILRNMLGGTGDAYFGSDTIPIHGSTDIFVSKVNYSGAVEWANVFGSNVNVIQNEGGQAYYDIVSNSLYLNGSCTDGSISFDSIYFQNPGSYFARMDLNGKFLWVKQINFSGGITFDNAGFIYLLGDKEIAKMDSLGNFLWIKQFSSPSNFYLGRIYFYNDSLLITGNGTNDFPLDSTVNNSPLPYYQFISVFDTSGNFQRVTTIRSMNFFGEYCSKLSDGKLIQVLIFKDSLSFGNYSFYGPGDAFLLSLFDLNGQFLWHKRFNYTGHFGIRSSEYTAGSIYLTGFFDNQFTYDSSITYTAINGQNCFVLSLDENGNYLNGFTLPKSEGNNIIRADDGSVVLAGSFSDTLQLGNISLISYGQTDIFILKMDSLNSIGEPHKIRQEELLIYANPNTGNCRLVVPDDIQAIDKLYLSITDITGKIIFRGKPEEMGNEIVVNLEQEASGKYFVQLTDGKKIYRGVIIFEK